jgi:cytoskeletal protein CcmA (bactofilin family)
MPNVRDLSATPPPMPAPQAPPDTTVIARGDRMEGTLKVNQAIRIAGTLDGKVEATTVHIDEGATVKADITAEEVVIAGEYTGKLVCRQRLEMRSTGAVTGNIETLRLMLHEGASIDGELHMVKPAKQPGDSARGGSSVRGGGLAEVPIRPVAQGGQAQQAAGSGGNASGQAAPVGSASGAGSASGQGADQSKAK